VTARSLLILLCAAWIITLDGAERLQSLFIVHTTSRELFDFLYRGELPTVREPFHALVSEAATSIRLFPSRSDKVEVLIVAAVSPQAISKCGTSISAHGSSIYDNGSSSAMVHFPMQL
jgi:hypothetical protein